MIRILNLINGEQIIGEVKRPEDGYLKDGYLKVYDPFYIVEAMTDDGSFGSKLTNVLTFSSDDYILIHEDKIVFESSASESMISYYKKLIEHYDKTISDKVINEALNEMDRAEKRYEKLMSMIKPDKTQLN